jgi:hypothetical protein
MTSRLSPIAIVLVATTLGAAQAPITKGVVPLVVHEWGTFTSIAGQDGTAAEWLPLSGPPDLPCFVDRLKLDLKGSLPGKVRMETPVLYFYAPGDITVNVNVRFRQGVITEWFPQAAVTPLSADSSTLGQSGFSGSIAWNDVKVSPRATAEFRTDAGASHYYVARQTDAAPLHVGAEKERFLFYRGVGDFEPPLGATVAADGTIVVKSDSGGPVGDVMLFENRGGTMTYQVRHSAGRALTFDRPAHDGEFAPPLAEFEQMLVAHGLYAKEAKAMVATWRDSWFEEGTRVFYLVSRKAIDSILPLDITPQPESVVRAFVGRLEVVTPSTLREVEGALTRNDRVALKKHGRFLQPIASRILADRPPADRARMEAPLRTLDSPGSFARVCR